ncbi:diguanylate cyclase [Desertifilum sp. FACHB-1129]|uniref:Serine/threonine protein kinase n=1 Tax=Desertifilum tharense IPPAS B-1220 TaxID=1781255 RepID=A0A1E5QMN3_9CYAN|nr:MULTISPECIES: diguanylate cyclase [Desertifilum]MDA0212713.1 diguanylate cyclase [Cyanobacteria bacterium FC1]MBD2313325.1 diguanylate cyclase [Desertifilum sp. FACHB-1129]MBD2324396.1 diguanylate cyclase [Desertifilum sp. FACHB-866]MBD2334410.1 diguanylate cyclase [Desertifilum sp. FACHB-868]OEJ75847.1 hypothetical protein BH720_07000 [Desertifilum tharense IPPAS B-1220]
MDASTGSTNALENLCDRIPGYRLREQLHSTSKTCVYRALREADGCQVIIKLLKWECSTFSDLLQFRNQFAIAKALDHPGILQVYRLEPYGKGYALSMEDFGGISLQQYRQTHSISVTAGLEIAIQLAEILNALYRYRIIHKNIQPSNILIHPETQHIKLTDFAIASQLPKEIQEIQNPNIWGETLAYLSPEQTGRMNRGVDYRTDLYSLGVTLYELLTDRLPFQSQDPMELVHAHLAQQPPAPHLANSQIPPIVSEIILKLMAKNAEDRYQSALGLKQDLEQCLEQLRATGTLEPFELGKQDRCDRFLIPEKLYGREVEVQALMTAFDLVSIGSTQMILVVGYSGIGKTAVISEIHKPIVRQHGYFIQGKFDQFHRNIPFSGFVQAFRDLIGQLLGENDTQLNQWKNKLLAALGEHAQVMVEIIPELEQIIGVQPPAPELSGSAVQNRFNRLFQKFIQVFATSEHPLTVFVDDLQWADAASLQLMQILLGGGETRYLFLMGAYRDNEVFPAHPLMRSLSGLRSAGVNFNTLILSDLGATHLNQLIADTLSCSLETALPLTQLVYQKTHGNPFFSIQFLKVLHREGFITFDRDRGSWQCNVTQIKAKVLTDNIVEFLGLRLQKLSAATQEVLKIAACVGNQFDLETLTGITQHSTIAIAVALWEALQEELILPLDEVYQFDARRDASPEALDSSELSQPALSSHYRFLHDRVQQAVYALIPEGERQENHLKISQLLLDKLAEGERDEKIFDIVTRLNYGVELLTQPEQREQLMQLNLMAGRKAKATTAYAAALEYFRVGMSLLGDRAWQTHYRLTLAFYEEAIEAAYLCGNFQQMEAWRETLISQTVDILDRVKTYEVQIMACVAQNQLQDAIAIALSVLHELGIDFPESPTPADWESAIAEVTQNLGETRVASAIDLPLMQDPHSQAALRILLSIDAPTYLCFPELLPLTICKEVNLSLVYGNLPGSAKAYANYGLILCSGLGDLNTGYEFGQLALSVLERLSAQELYARTSFLVNFMIRHWQEPLRHTLKSLQEAYGIGLETGDLLHGALAAEKYCYHAYYAGEGLVQLAEEMEFYAEQMRHLNQDVALCTHQIHWQGVLNLLGETQNPCELTGRACNEQQMLPLFLEKNARTALYYFYFNKLLLAYLFGDYSQALHYAQLTEPCLDGSSGQYIGALFYFYDSLAQLAVDANGDRQQAILEKVAANQTKLHHWAHHAPMNFQHKYDLVAAERHRVLGEVTAAIEAYDRAIQNAIANGYIQEAALANELAAQFYLQWHKPRIAQSYLLDAYYTYARWGAKAKTDCLERQYPQYLLPILQHRQLNAGAANFLAKPICPLHPTTQPLASPGVPALAALDCGAIFKTLQTLSSEIHLNQLLTNLLNIAIATAGATKCVLLLHWEDSLRVEAVTQLGQEPKILQAIPVDESTEVPISLIYKVKRNLKTFVVDRVAQEATLLADAYIGQQQPKSLLCTPILNQGKLIGILYLENHRMAAAFTRDRIEILNFLCCQAAISLENARLYEQLRNYSYQLEMKVAERTNELEAVNRELYRMVTLDGLTLVSNRRHFDTYLKEQWQRLLLAQLPLGLLLCDIDYFKGYNDYYGHQAGDECLKQVAQLLSQAIQRLDDLLARYGGEEFAIILPNTDVRGAVQVAKRIGNLTQDRQLPYERSRLVPYITLSIGISSLIPRPDTSWEMLITQADRALYQAKSLGRNRYCIYEPSTS